MAIGPQTASVHLPVATSNAIWSVLKHDYGHELCEISEIIGLIAACGGRLTRTWNAYCTLGDPADRVFAGGLRIDPGVFESNEVVPHIATEWLLADDNEDRVWSGLGVRPPGPSALACKMHDMSC